MSKIVATSDLHGNLPDTPECDILLIAGDSTPLSLDREIDRCLYWLDKEFREWLEAQPAKHIVGIAGNHDFVIERRKKDFKELELPWTYLEDTETTVEGVTIYGTPWVPNLKGWAFYGDDRTLRMAYEAVPDGTDIVISHGPPDLFPMNGGHHEWTSQRVNEMIKRVQPRAVVCGHIHEGFSKRDCEGIPVYNVSYVDEFYVPQDRFGFIDLLD
jgi:Icc-related predicted phosphoesterase